MLQSPPSRTSPADEGRLCKCRGEFIAFLRETESKLPRFRPHPRPFSLTTVRLPGEGRTFSVPLSWQGKWEEGEGVGGEVDPDHFLETAQGRRYTARPMRPNETNTFANLFSNPIQPPPPRPVQNEPPETMKAPEEATKPHHENLSDITKPMVTPEVQEVTKVLKVRKVQKVAKPKKAAKNATKPKKAMKKTKKMPKKTKKMKKVKKVAKKVKKTKKMSKPKKAAKKAKGKKRR